MNIRYLIAIIILFIVPMGCATNQERPASEARAGTAQRDIMRGEFDRVEYERARHEHQQIQRHYRALARMQEQQQMRENLAGR